VQKLSIPLTVALVLVAMLWGNCLSCPQIADAHSCCHKPQPASAACHTQILRHFVKAEKAVPVAPSVALLADLPSPIVLARQVWAVPVARADVPPGGSNSPLTLRV
jgi:hypothetical protein